MAKIIEKILENLQDKAEISVHLIDLITSQRHELHRKAKRGPKQFKKNWAQWYKERQQIYSLLNKLKRQGFIAKSGRQRNSLWNITKRGEEKLAKLQEQNTIVEGKDVVIITYDVPERERRKRDLLRRELLSMGFKKLQQSVWVGKILVPPEFITDLRREQLLSHTHIFSISKSGTITENSHKTTKPNINGRRKLV